MACYTPHAPAPRPQVHCTRPILGGRTRWLSTGELTASLRHLHLLGYRLAELGREGGGVDATFIRAVCPTGGEAAIGVK